jgi:signal transduction histidine kinase/DNA-binding response OmpR family regulator
MSKEPQPEARANVLIVDDNPNNLLALEAILAELDANLVRAGSGTEALRRILDQDFAAILLDIQMPGMDGFETATLIRQRERSRAIPIIFLTAFPSNDTQVFQGYSIGAVDFLFKPIVAATLKTKVSVFIELFKKTEEIKRQEALLREIQAREHEQKLVEARQRWQAERLRESNERLKLLADIANRLLTEDHPEKFLGPLYAQIAAHLGLEIFFHYRVDESGTALILETSGGLATAPGTSCHRLAFGQDGSGAAAQHRQRVVIEDIQGTADPRAQLSRELGLSAFASFPLLAQQRLMGVLSFGTRGRAYLKADELAVLQVICDQVAMTMERARLISELQRRAEELAEVDRRKDQFLAMLAHELRNPLAPIVNALEIMRLREEPDPVYVRARSAMERQVRHMVHLVDDLLDVSRISTGKVTLRQEPVLLADIVQQAVETSRPLITKRNHALTIDLPRQAVRLFADRTRLSQVISNLLNNAAKYTDPGGRITLSCERDGDDVVIRVRDTGIGISVELLPRVFDLFVQADRAADRALGGLGIGLTVAQRLVQMHGGSITARSKGLGQGSEFMVRLPGLPSEQRRPPQPLMDADADELAEDLDEDGPRRELSPGPRMRVLLIEDNDDIRSTLQDLLLAHGHQVDVAGDGIEGLRLAQLQRPDVALIDIGLPKLDGYQVAARFRAELPRPPVMIALSGYGQPDDRSRARTAGFDAHLVKPVRLDDLLHALADAHAGAATRAPVDAAAPEN